MPQATTEQQPSPISRQQKVHNNSLFRRLMKQWDVQLMVIPGVILIFIFAYLPMYGVITGFMDYSIFTGSRIFENPWVGFKHFEAFLMPQSLRGLFGIRL